MATTAAWNKSEMMQKGGWKIDSNEEACYVDIDADAEEEVVDENRINSQWSNLPDLLLEDIFRYLTIKERYYASLVCRQWNRAFYMPNVWDNFVVNDRTLTRTKFNYYSGWQYCLDHIRTQYCLSRVGKYMRGLEFCPEHSFNNIYQFITMLTWSMQSSTVLKAPELAGVGNRIRSLVYVFPCNMSQANDPEGLKLFGTGGQLLKGLKELLAKLTKLHTLKLIDFVLERFEAKHLLDEVLYSCCTKMRVLNLVNVTTTHCPIMHVGLFLNLQILTISPQNVDDDVLLLLAADTKLKHLHLLQNRYTPSSVILTHCSAKTWRIVKRDNPRLKVHLRLESLSDGEVVFQPEAPVASVTYNAPKTMINPEIVLRMVDNYKNTLAAFGHELLPRFACPKSFHNRIDSLMLLLCRQCFNLQTLVIREKISTSTVLLIAKTAKNLRQLHVRRFSVILRCDWSRHPEWSDAFFAWLRLSSRSYESVETEVSQILGYKWCFLSDCDFKRVEVDVRRSL